MRGAWGCVLLALTAVVGCGSDGATVTSDRATVTTAGQTSAPSETTPPDDASDHDVAITYRHRATTFTYVQRGEDTATLGESSITIDIAGEDPVGCWLEDEGWECLSFNDGSTLGSLSELGTFQTVLDELPPTDHLDEALTVTGRAARCGEIQPSDELLLAITSFSGTDVNRGAEDIEPTTLCIDEGSGLPLSLRTPVPAKDGAVEITSTEARPATDADFTPPAVVIPNADIDLDGAQLDQDCCDGS